MNKLLKIFSHFSLSIRKPGKLLKTLILLFFFAMFLNTTYAETGDQSYDTWYKAVTGPGFNKQSFDDGTLSDLQKSWLTDLAGPDDGTGGAVSMGGDVIASLYDNPPASGAVYIAYTLDNMGIVQPAYAQEGAGFRAFLPILPLWRAFRNLAYIGFIIVFVVMGFSIMFRTRISPQAVMTVQAALPKIIVSLIMVTFSYAIAGLMIDLSYVLFFVFIEGLKTGGGISDVKANAIIQGYTTGGFTETIGSIVGQGTGAVIDIIKSVWPD